MSNTLQCQMTWWLLPSAPVPAVAAASTTTTTTTHPKMVVDGVPLTEDEVAMVLAMRQQWVAAKKAVSPTGSSAGSLVAGAAATKATVKTSAAAEATVALATLKEVFTSANVGTGTASAVQKKPSTSAGVVVVAAARNPAVAGRGVEKVVGRGESEEDDPINLEGEGDGTAWLVGGGDDKEPNERSGATRPGLAPTSPWTQTPMKGLHRTESV